MRPASPRCPSKRVNPISILGVCLLAATSITAVAQHDLITSNSQVRPKASEGTRASEASSALSKTAGEQQSSSDAPSNPGNLEQALRKAAARAIELLLQPDTTNRVPRFDAGREAYEQSLHYYHGDTVRKNLKKAVQLLREAAQQDSAPAKFGLANLYGKGEGVPRDEKLALHWMCQAAEQGFGGAQLAVGIMHLSGKQLPHDPDRGIDLIAHALAQHNPVVQAQIGEGYAQGKALPQDYVRAYLWLNLAGAAGHRKAIEARDKLVTRMTPTQIAEGQATTDARLALYDLAGREATSSADFGSLAGRPRTSGTGFFITDDGYFVTCAHVLSKASRLEVKLKDNTLKATLVKSDAANDIALLKIAGTFHSLPLAASRGVRLGDRVFTVGFPNLLLQGKEPKLTRGEISSLAGVRDDPRSFQVSVQVQPGNSGGPLVNELGQVVGLVTTRLSDLGALRLTGQMPQNVNYALRSSILSAFLETVPEVALKEESSPAASERSTNEIVQTVVDATALVVVY